MECTDLSIGRLIARYELGALEPVEQDAFIQHLIQCEYCHNEVYAMAPFMGVLRAHRVAVQQGEMTPRQAAIRGVGEVTSPPLWHRKVFLVAASLLLTLSAGLLAVYLVRQQPAPNVVEHDQATTPTPEVASGGSPVWRDLEIPKASYALPNEQALTRGTGPTTAFERAMTAYGQNDFVAAAEQLEIVCRLEPEHAEAHFYQGVSLLLADQSADAIKPLRRAVQLSIGAHRESSHYYLALAFLKTDRVESALTELEAVLDMNGPHRADAEKLKQQVITDRE